MPVVMSTGFQVVEGEARSMDLGSIHYLTKHWNIDILKATVRVAIREGLARPNFQATRSPIRVISGSGQAI